MKLEGEFFTVTNYQTIFNTTNEAIFVHDARSGQILDINDRMLEIYGIFHVSKFARPFLNADRFYFST